MMFEVVEVAGREINFVRSALLSNELFDGLQIQPLVIFCSATVFFGDSAIWFYIDEDYCVATVEREFRPCEYIIPVIGDREKCTNEFEALRRDPVSTGITFYRRMEEVQGIYFLFLFRPSHG
ncbi:hypothetical protein Har1131_17435 [Haloarcula sp. CBA1131]|nr:hypothetical protein Har1131_17435 [Haloarcula sp. CBA1131]